MDALTHLNTALTGRYEVEREIGAGGMATAYPARDLRHERSVALKVLKPELGAVLGVERFFSEIRVTAKLQHPNLLALFDSGEAEGMLFYVMPYVDGETLRARLDREKQLPVDESVRIASAIASALDYAHAHGVIHRDLKPENILFQAGEPVLADFGIALAVANAGGSRITQTGLSLGTPQYMSPEQATGDRVIDGRTDIYSLAAVLYEMLTGEPPHTGSTAQAIIARVLTDKPRSVRATREMVPPHVESAIERALAKLPADRFSSAREFAQALGGAHAATFTGAGAAPMGRTGDFRIAISIPRAKLLAGARWAAAAAVVVLGAWGWLRPARGARMTRVRFELVLPDSAGVRAEIGGQNFALSPDGARIVYLGGAGNDQLYQRGMNDLDARPIRGTEQARYPRFSPDGQWVGFVQSGRLKKIPLSGGPAVPIAENVTHVSWGERDVIAFTGAGTLWRVSATGGVPGRVATLDTTRGETSIWPHVLPGGRSAVFGIVTAGDIASTELAGVGFDEREVLRLGVTGTNPRYLASGHLILGRLDGTVIALPFDVGRMRVTGPAVTVLDGVYVKSGGATELGVSGDGTLAYIEGQSRAQLVLVNHAGGARPLLPTLREYGYPRYSPVGGRIVFQMADPGGFSRTDIWVYNDLTRTLARLTNDGRNSRPAWSADGRHVMWLYRDTAGGTTLRRQMWGGTDKPEQLLPGLAISEVTQSPSGKFHVGTTRRPGTGVDIWIADGDPPSAPRFLVATPASEGGPQVSPDGRWIAYFGDESEQREVYVTAVTGRGGRHQISKAGGAEPAWAPDGRSLYYRTAGRRMVARISTSPAFVVTRRDTVFSDNFRASAPRPSMTCPAMEGNS